RGAIHCDQFVGAVSRGRNELRPYIQPFIGVGLSGVARGRNELRPYVKFIVLGIRDRQITPSHFCVSFPAAAVSSIQVTSPLVGRTIWAGYSSGWYGPSRTAWTASAFSLPVTRKRTCLGAFKIGGVKVRRSGGGLGTLTGMTSRCCSCNDGWCGKSDAVCPSGTIPSWIKSKAGMPLVLKTRCISRVYS